MLYGCLLSSLEIKALVADKKKKKEKKGGERETGEPSNSRKNFIARWVFTVVNLIWSQASGYNASLSLSVIWWEVQLVFSELMFTCRRRLVSCAVRRATNCKYLVMIGNPQILVLFYLDGCKQKGNEVRHRRVVCWQWWWGLWGCSLPVGRGESESSWRWWKQSSYG